MQAFLAQAGANYSAGQGPMTGLVSTRSSPAAEAVILDLQSMPVRLWATELATLFQAASDAASEKLRWCDPSLGLLGGLQGLHRSAGLQGCMLGVLLQSGSMLCTRGDLHETDGICSQSLACQRCRSSHGAAGCITARCACAGSCSLWSLVASCNLLTQSAYHSAPAGTESPCMTRSLQPSSPC